MIKEYNIKKNGDKSMKGRKRTLGEDMKKTVFPK
jgi:hypothetical protein